MNSLIKRSVEFPNKSLNLIQRFFLECLHFPSTNVLQDRQHRLQENRLKSDIHYFHISFCGTLYIDKTHSSPARTASLQIPCPPVCWRIQSPTDQTLYLISHVFILHCTYSHFYLCFPLNNVIIILLFPP